MEIRELINSIKSDKKAITVITVLGTAGLCLIMLSSVLSEDSGREKEMSESPVISDISECYCSDTEKRLEEFLKNIEGVGEVKVYLTVSGDEEYVYATEGKTSISENKKEEERKYVMIGSSGDKTALVETVKAPEISGAVIACTGCNSASVQEKVYKAVSTALDIPTSQIYVTKLK